MSKVGMPMNRTHAINITIVLPPNIRENAVPNPHTKIMIIMSNNFSTNGTLLNASRSI